jgi:hypothetical protein
MQGGGEIPTLCAISTRILQRLAGGPITMAPCRRGVFRQPGFVYVGTKVACLSLYAQLEF